MPKSGLAFNHAMLYVKDSKRAVRFYRDLLGFKVISSIDGYARVRAPRGGSTIGLHEFGPRAKRPPKGALSHRLYFEVRDLDAFCARLKNRGVKFDQDPEDMPWGWRHAYLKDPDGHLLSLYFAGSRRLNAP
ncbi:MAG TPA: VOC family protein [Candidatus Thermoplasmatota archaeon]|nr:VOC family protein [Candidatus Thermoplasmatota archaeon]